MSDQIEDVLQFWFGTLNDDERVAGEVKQRWFKKDPAFDQEIRDRFSARYQAIVGGQCEDWLSTARGALAYVIVLDQFSRNMFRNEAAMYAADEQALAAASATIDRGADTELASDLRVFLYMPFMHAEDVAAQERCVELFGTLCAGDSADHLKNNLHYAEVHRDIVVKFGRFPHRNPIVGREMTDAEQAFLDAGGPSF